MRISDWSSDVCSSDLGGLGGGVDAGERLVHEVQVGFLGQRPGQEHPLLLSAGELADLPAGEVRHADLVETGQRRRAVPPGDRPQPAQHAVRSEEHTSELQSLMRISYAVFCLKKKKKTHNA